MSDETVTSGRNALGHFTKGSQHGKPFEPGNVPANAWELGNVVALKTGAHSAAFWASVATEKAALVESAREDLAADATAAVTGSGLMQRWAEAHLLATSFFAQMEKRGGAFTGKGRMSALYRAYLAASEREERLAKTLGLTRQAKPVMGLDAYVQKNYSGRSSAATELGAPARLAEGIPLLDADVRWAPSTTDTDEEE